MQDHCSYKYLAGSQIFNTTRHQRHLEAASYKYLCTKSFILVNVFLKNQRFSLFPIVKMNVNYAEICREGNLEADFQQVLLVIFCAMFTILL